MTAPAHPLAVAAHGVGRRFGRTWALAHVDLEVPFGTSVWLRGANGAGKTTLLRMLASLSAPSRGDLFVVGFDVRAQREAIRGVVALVSHALYLYPGLTARETLSLWMRLGPDGEDADAVAAHLEAVGLLAAAERRVGEFSAGMRKRLAIARARLEEPRLLLLDEPFSSLDPAGCGLVEDWVREFAAAGGTVIMASHDHERSLPLCERVVDLRNGQIVGEGGGR
jgi:heme ABC exporter ATP-binding subunit CcmA